MRDLNGVPGNRSGDSAIDNQLRWKAISGDIVAFSTTDQGTTATVGGQPATLPATVQAITVVNILYMLARTHPIEAKQEDSGWSVHFIGPKYVEVNRDAVGTGGCSGDACGGLACGAQGNTAGSCGAEGCGAQGGVGGVCFAQGCGGDACGVAGCAANACGANACFGDAGILPCLAEACFLNSGLIPECPFLL